MNKDLNQNMKVKLISTLCIIQRVLIGLCLLVITPIELEGARRRPSFEEDNSILLREVLDNLDNLKNDVRIHESQMTIYEERFKNLEEIIDSIRQQTCSTVQSVKDTLKNHVLSLDSKLSDQENMAKELTHGVKSFTSENQQVLNDFKKRIEEIERIIQLQNQNMENLQTALTSVIEIIKGREGSVDKFESASGETSAKFYKVKAGDSLERIAKQNQTSIKKLKELNNLTGDQIIVGQKLKIHE